MINLGNKKILLVRNDNIGDLICTTPAIEALRTKYPNNQIDIVVNSYNYAAINKNPFVNKVYCYTKPKHKSGLWEKIKAGLGKLKILIAIKKENYDVVVVFRSGYSKSAELFSNITKALYKVGVKDIKNKDKFNIHIPVNSDEHEVEFCFNCLKPFGVIYDNEKTKFFIDEKETIAFQKYTNIIVFHISARMKNNKMSIEKLKNIFLSLNKTIYITAEPKDFKMAAELEKMTKAKFLTTNSFLNLGALIQYSKLFITLEGGTMHLAPAIGVKTIALFGYSNINRWYPWGYKDLVMQDKSKLAENIDNALIIKKIQDNL